VLRYYTVFNVEQCSGLENHLPVETSKKEFEPDDRCEKVLTGMLDPPAISHGKESAYYRAATDTINMPHKDQFDTTEEYYSTLFHELVHSSGHKKRLARPEVMSIQALGSHNYSKEELVAEIGSAFLCGFCKIENSTLENNAAYIDHWQNQIKKDKRLIIHAAAQAQKAADYILGEKRLGTTIDCSPEP